ncbi:VWA domain-containing protein [Methylomarinum sp. Ch1-1]|uniref:VWA domain-containing protein n=1 Tax=Methylomarinum roseum TaxID=3067653 RepID=A0AAU7NW42_9GAMM|nr:VWA domain-containing protein [Methylomarinum sp. Ch1-1]MDP4522680.1 VWA domain-containing protein [Methylomarinum sp. Ch1-1]
MNLAEFHFIRPYWLLALLPALVLIMLSLKKRLGRGNWSEVCDAALLPYILQDRAVEQSRWPLTAASLAALLGIVALAGPTWERLPAPVFRNDAALVIALDLSRSMNASDIKPSRLIRARYKIADILNRRKDGQTALLVYAGDAFTVTPLTEDNETIASQLNALHTSIMPSQGSNAESALKLAIDLLRQAGLQQGQILLIGDAITADVIDEASELLGAYRLSVLGVGTAEGAPVKAAEGGFLKDVDGNIVVPKLNAEQLSALAAAGDGVYRSISADDSDIEALLSAMDQPKTDKQEHNPLYLDQWAEKGPWLLLLVLPLAALSFRKGLLTMTFFVLLPFPQDSFALEWRDLWTNPNQQAQQAFEQQQYQQAAEQFESLPWKAAAQYKAGQYQQAAETLQNIDTADGHYNRGNALAKTGQYQQALEAYRQALQIDPGHEDAQYNKDLVEKELEKQQQQNQQQDDNSRPSDQQQQQNQDGEPSQQSGERQDSERQQTDAEQQNDNQQPEASEQTPQDDGQQRENESPRQAEQAAEQQEQAAQQTETEESEQASEQWLKRIPDDPSGLLKRKFRYQYGRRGRKPASTDQTW